MTNKKSSTTSATQEINVFQEYTTDVKAKVKKSK